MKITPYAIAMGYRDPNTGHTVVAHFTVQCAECKTIVREGHPDMPVSHGLCESCAKAWLPEPAA